MISVKQRKIFSISMVKNEEDIIESFVRYHRNIFDGMVIVDHGSNDQTLTILEKLKVEGIPLFIQNDDSVDYLQDKIMTKLLYDTFNQFDPDIVIPLDADEFLIAAERPVNPKRIMNSIDLNKIHYLRFRNYYPNGNENPNELFIPKRIQNFFDGGFCKVLVTKENLKDLPFLTMGNHNLSNYYGKNINMEVSTELELAHFPVRSLEQLKSKALVGWISNLTRHDRSEGECHHWEQWFTRIKENPSINLHELLSDFTLTSKPINLSFCSSLDIKYTPAQKVNYMKNLLEYCELLAKGYADMKRNVRFSNGRPDKVPLGINQLASQIDYDFPGLQGYIDKVEVKENHIVCNGWARNPLTGESAKEILIVNQANKIIARSLVYQIRKDVAAHFRNQKMLRSGWRAVFDKQLLPAGRSTLFVFIYLRDKKRAIRIKQPINLTI